MAVYFFLFINKLRTVRLLVKKFNFNVSTVIQPYFLHMRIVRILVNKLDTSKSKHKILHLVDY